MFGYGRIRITVVGFNQNPLQISLFSKEVSVIKREGRIKVEWSGVEFSLNENKKSEMAFNINRLIIQSTNY